MSKVDKRYFKVQTGAYGGELTVGTVTEEFVEYWKNRVDEEGNDSLVETLQSYEWNDSEMGDPKSPKPKEDFYAWPECDDIEHVNGPFSDNRFSVVEIKLHKNAQYKDGTITWKDGKEPKKYRNPYDEVGDTTIYDYSVSVYNREAYSQTEKSEEGDDVPVLYFLSSEKGSFGEVYVETNGEDFDPEKLQIGTVDTDLCNIIESYWYDRKPLQVDFDNSDSIGKGCYASVGYMNRQWHDTADLYVSYDMTETERVQELFADIYGE